MVGRWLLINIETLELKQKFYFFLYFPIISVYSILFEKMFKKSTCKHKRKYLSAVKYNCKVKLTEEVEKKKKKLTW